MQQHVVEHGEHEKAQKKSWSSTASGLSSRCPDTVLPLDPARSGGESEVDSARLSLTITQFTAHVILISHHQQSFLPQTSLVLSATGSLELRLVSSAFLEHTNSNSSHSWLGLVIVSNDRRTSMTFLPVQTEVIFSYLGYEILIRLLTFGCLVSHLFVCLCWGFTV